MSERPPSDARAHVLLLAGTRPEVLKLAPLARALRAKSDVLRSSFATLEQQPELIDLAARELELPLDRRARPASDRASARQGDSLLELAAELLDELDPDVVVVQGDTNSALAGARAAHARGLALVHVEAGLRTGDPRQPYPEELNRIEIARLAALHYAPTAGARAHLEDEGVGRACIEVTGNTGVDALLQHSLPARDPLALWSSPRRRIVVTAHRRENHGSAVRALCSALQRIAEERPGVEIQFVLHPNPNASDAPVELLSGTKGVELFEPLPQAGFLELLSKALFAITDSGGVQEEAPYLGLPLLVMRSRTERPEALSAGVARLVGSDPSAIADAALELLDDRAAYVAMARRAQPFGDGRAAQRIATDLARRFGRGGRRERAPSAAGLARFLLSRAVLPDGAVASWHNPAHPGHPYPEAAALVLNVLARHVPRTEALRERIAERLWNDRGPFGGYGKSGLEYTFDTAIAADALLAHATRLCWTTRWTSHGTQLLARVRGALMRKSAFLDPAAPSDPHWSRSYGCHLLKCALAFPGRGEHGDPLLDELLRELLPLQAPDGRFRIHARSDVCYVHAHAYALEGLAHLAARGWRDAEVPFELGVTALARWQRDDGALPAFAPAPDTTNEPRADATAQAVRLWLCADPRSFAKPIARARRFLASAQAWSGGLRYTAYSADENTWATAFALQAENWIESGEANALELF